MKGENWITDFDRKVLNFEQISHIVLLFPLLSLNKQVIASLR